MMLADFTSPALLIPRLTARDMAGALQELSRRLHEEKRVPNLLQFYLAALNREMSLSTDMAPGMAFPHVRLPGLETLSFAFGRSAVPLPWGSQTTSRVHLIFLMAVPDPDASQYLKFIPALARFAQNQPLVEALNQADTAAEIMDVFRQASLRPKKQHPHPA